MPEGNSQGQGFLPLLYCHAIPELQNTHQPPLYVLNKGLQKANLGRVLNVHPGGIVSPFGSRLVLFVPPQETEKDLRAYFSEIRKHLKTHSFRSDIRLYRGKISESGYESLRILPETDPEGESRPFLPQIFEIDAASLSLGKVDDMEEDSASRLVASFLSAAYGEDVRAITLQETPASGWTHGVVVNAKARPLRGEELIGLGARFCEAICGPEGCLDEDGTPKTVEKRFFHTVFEIPSLI